ncbi:MAG: carbohydrate binding family 9 domain-containing protein [Cyclobacteriaceae bacterium]|nr:carbohydrate binding family 9 domain-containing protein [Cyclobacteriaceae bacterium]
MKNWYLFILLTALLPIEVLAQVQPGHELPIRKAGSTIKLDGVLDEPEWNDAAVATDFYMNYPYDSLAPKHQTQVRFTFDQHFLYISFVCFDDSVRHVVQSLRRDFDFMLNDNVGISIDPYNDYTNGFFFNITPYGVQGEATVSGGGTMPEQYNSSWDNKWYSEVRQYHDRWIAELAIPFKSFRYNSQAPHWNVAVVRNDLKRNEVSGWIKTPIQYVPSSFAYSGRLIWVDPPPKAGANVSVIPYVVASSTEDKENAVPAEFKANAGFDAKVAITSSLNMDVTVNPDFSNVEVDKQVINLTRFEFQFPERRQFFLENSDLFSTPGFTGFTQPFFSRRLGLASDSSGNLAKVPILYGARVSGKIGSHWRLGVMNMQTKAKAALGLPDQNYSVAVVQRQVFKRSNMDVFVVNKQSIGLGEYVPGKYYAENLVKKFWNGQDSVMGLHRYNRVLGTDFNLITKSNRWGGKAYYHQSLDDFVKGQAFSHGGYLNYMGRTVQGFVGYIDMGKNYNAESGFVPSMAVYPGNYGAFSVLDFKIYPKSKSIAIITPGVEVDYTYIPGGMMTDRTIMQHLQANFRNTAQINLIARNIYQKLPADFNVLDPHGDSTFLQGQEFRWEEYNIKFMSDTRKRFTYILNGIGGQFYNGTRTGLNGMVSYRVQPYGSLSVTFDYNDVKLPSAYGHESFLLLSPRLDMTFSRKVFLTTFVQYNDRYDNMNLNARFQWRFKPASDLFVVYTENYVPGIMSSKNRALVLKMTYWLNL